MKKIKIIVPEYLKENTKNQNFRRILQWRLQRIPLESLISINRSFDPNRPNPLQCFPISDHFPYISSMHSRWTKKWYSREWHVVWNGKSLSLSGLGLLQQFYTACPRKRFLNLVYLVQRTSQEIIISISRIIHDFLACFAHLYYRELYLREFENLLETEFFRFDFILLFLLLQLSPQYNIPFVLESSKRGYRVNTMLVIYFSCSRNKRYWCVCTSISERVMLSAIFLVIVTCAVATHGSVPFRGECKREAIFQKIAKGNKMNNRSIWLCTKTSKEMLSFVRL